MQKRNIETKKSKDKIKINKKYNINKFIENKSTSRQHKTT